MSKSVDSSELINKYEAELKKLNKAINSLESNLDLIQKGDEQGSYWNGSVAFNTIKDSLTQLDYDKNLVKELTKCLDYLKNVKND